MAIILIIEDDALLAEMYEAKFSHAGHSTKLATNGREGLELAAAATPDLILLDVLMPGLNGFAVLKELKKHAHTRYTPTILLTNLAQAEVEMSRDLAKTLGICEYLVKSHHTPADVVRRAEHHLSRKGK